MGGRHGQRSRPRSRLSERDQPPIAEPVTIQLEGGVLRIGGEHPGGGTRRRAQPLRPPEASPNGRELPEAISQHVVAETTTSLGGYLLFLLNEDPETLPYAEPNRHRPNYETWMWYRDEAVIEAQHQAIGRRWHDEDRPKQSEREEEYQASKRRRESSYCDASSPAWTESTPSFFHNVTITNGLASEMFTRALEQLRAGEQLAHCAVVLSVLGSSWPRMGRNVSARVRLGNSRGRLANSPARQRSVTVPRTCVAIDRSRSA